jgi:hypothetical protein
MKILIAAAAAMTFSAALQVSAPPVAIAQSTAPFCLKSGTTGKLNCTFATMGECEQARPGASSDQCMTRSDAGGVTGLGDDPKTGRPNPTTGTSGQSPSSGAKE